MKNLMFRITNLLLIIILPFAAMSQSGGQFSITQTIIAGGGGQNSSDGAFSVDGTIGQTIAGDTSLSGLSILTSGFWNFNPFAGQGFEADVAPRGTGDGVILSNDVIQVQRFQIGLDEPNQTNELQRADSAPFVSHGDDIIQSNDVIQAQRYQIGLEAAQNAAGPGAFVAIVENQSIPSARHKAGATENTSNETRKTLTEKSILAPTAPRLLHLQNASGGPGQQVQVNILVDALGDESAYGFTMSFNPAILTNPTTTIGAAGGTRLCNTSIAGRISCSIINFPNNNPTSSTDQIGEILPGDNQVLLRVTFTIAPNASGGDVALTLSNVNTSNDEAANLTIGSQNGVVTIVAPTATDVSVSGRVFTADDIGLHNAIVVITDVSGNSRSARTNPFGNFHFEGIEVGRTYVFQVVSKSFIFAPQIVAITDEITDLNFTAQSP